MRIRFDLVHSAQIRKGRIGRSSISELPWDAVSNAPFEKKVTKQRRPRRPRRDSKLHPLLARWVAERKDEREELLDHLP